MRHAEEVTFGGSGLDRAAELRGDIPALAALMQQESSRTVVLWRGKVLVEEGLCRLPLDHPVLTDARGAPLFLGREEGGAVFAHDLSGWEPEGAASIEGGFLDGSEQQHPACAPEQRFVELRTLLNRLSPRDAELAATARALFNWHATHGFCARCGAASDVFLAGWQRVCPACGAHHFPRTDPVVIMLVTRGNACLLGRSHGWPEGMYSCLAGFVEPGETLEAAVRREVQEEAGVKIGAVRYLASQPWPFPASLMIGCQGIAESAEIEIDPVEIEAARWVSREELADAFGGGNPGLMPARKGSIAHFLLRNWLADRLD
ncbi:NAD(+) diphosphatase [Salipiger sp. P9]|uniref:NAD(+) diphosphatase n=1 Tax=Salipiger pentaromativorans TaxID=2943193 RepID=UPI0021572EC7|nr:NAD(+) diphosphatase [Salipiger pentaromativorans]MCR8546748.1 NAD(+) diphosphatase [Salipiger pentaromativorans]